MTPRDPGPAASTGATLVASMTTDVRLQWRQGFWLAAGFVVLAGIVVLRWVPPGVRSWLLPLVVFGNVQMNAFYFVAGLVMLEREEGSLEALAVTPQAPGVYLASKVATLTLLSLAENGLLVLVLAGARRDAPALAVGVVACAVPFVLAGLPAVARYGTVNRFLMPSVVWVAALSVPLLRPLAGVDHPLLRLHPLDAGLALLQIGCGAEAPGGWPLLLALAAAAGWCVAGWRVARRAVRRLVVIETRPPGVATTGPGAGGGGRR